VQISPYPGVSGGLEDLDRTLVVYSLETVSAGLPDDAYKVYESVTAFEEGLQALACDNVASVIG
jgi:hypothetical protein